MKPVMKTLATALLIVFSVLILLPEQSHGQIVNEKTRKRISIGVGMMTDIWLNVPDGMKVRAINQGVNVIATYNMPIGKGNVSFAAGLGITVHNMYWNYMYRGNDDSLQFVQVPDTIDFKRSKITFPYLELPLELRLKTKSKVTAAIGFKLGYMVNGHSKWVGDDYIDNTSNELKFAVKNIRNIEKFAYGPTLRVGYKWFNVNAYYSLSSVFVKGKGPDMYPISVGFILMPF